jgi:hypothetical protein
MRYTVVLRRNADGESRRVEGYGEWRDGTEFWWTEGNFGCDCNRWAEFERAGGHEPDDDDWADVPGCLNDPPLYTAIKAILEDGTEMPLDKVEATP